VGLPCDVLPTVDAAMEKVPANPPAVIVAKEPEKAEVLDDLSTVLKRNAPATPFLVALSSANMDEAMDAMKRGAYDCVAAPYERFDELAAAKRASAAHGRTLFVSKVKPRPRKVLRRLAVWTVGVILVGIGVNRLYGPPTDMIDLGSGTTPPSRVIAFLPAGGPPNEP
jgi:DNA-binding NtrC family response regulator